MQGFQYTGGEPQAPPPKPSGCSTILLVLVTLGIFAGGGAFYWLARRTNEDPLAVAGVPSNSATTLGILGVGTGSGPDSWDGQTTLECTGVDHIELTGKTIAATASPAIRATGACTVALVGCTITAPVVVEATGGSHVTITGGAITGGVRAIDASGGAHVDVVGATVTGHVARSGGAVITGIAK